MSIPRIKKLILKKLSYFALIALLGVLQSSYAAGFTDTHEDGNVTSGPGGVTWTKKLSNNGWSESSGSVSSPINNSEGQLVNDYNCKDDGTLIVSINNGNNVGQDGYKAGILFRWTGTSSFYYMFFEESWNNLNIHFLENSIAYTGGQTYNITPWAENVDPFEVKIVLENNDFLIYVNGTYYVTFSDNSHSSGQVGYGGVASWSSAITFESVTWTELSTGPPVITTHPSNATKAVGESVTFTVATTADPPITGYQWKKDGSPIGGATSGSYTISSVVLGDAGTYTVDVTNDLGTTPSNGAVLTVYEPALITDDPDNVTTLVGTNATFTVIASGTPPLTYQWEMHNTSSWSNVGSDHPSYTLNSVQLSHDGYRFRCTVTGYNSTSDQSAEATLQVTSVASIVTEPVTPREIAIGDSVIFSVVADGNPAPDFQWEKLNGSIWDPVGFNIDTFAIDPVSLADEGTYRVRVWNPYGADTSDSAYLLVYDSTMTITSHPANDTVLAGDTATFGITASGASIIYQWQIRPSGGSFSDIAGAASDTLKYEASSGDDGAWFRCAVASGPVKDTSNVAVLTIGTPPSVTSSFSSDTVIPVDGNLTLTGSANAIPSPAYEWFFIYPGADPASKGTGATLSLTNAAKADSGIYYFVASNSFGSSSSDSIFVHVLSPVSITTDLPASYSAIDGGAAVFSIGVAGDGTVSYQWYENGAVMGGQTNSSLSINPIDSATHDGNTYHCEVLNTYLGVTVGTVTSTVCMLRVGQFYNPFKVTVGRIYIHNTTQVRVKLWSDVDLSNFPTTSHPFNPWADSVWVMYKTNGYASSPSEASIALFSTEAIKQAAPDSLESILTVGDLPVPHDSCFWFNYSVKWHNPDTLLKPFLQSDKVFMLDTTAPPNPLVVHGQYVKRDTVKLTIDSISNLNASTDSLVIVQSSRYNDFSQFLFTDTFSVTVLLAGGVSYTYVRIDSVDNFPLQTISGTDTVHCRWFTIGNNTAISTKLKTLYMIGWPRPVYSGILTADSTYLGDQLRLEWSAPQAGTDSLRVWYSTTPIPVGQYDPGLPSTQAFYPQAGVTVDTLAGLSPETVYYLGLQIFKDEMWSVITHASGDTATTSQGNPDIVPNVICVDSTGFDSTRNSMLIYWHIDLSTAPSGSFYQSGHTFKPDSLLDTASIKPASWDSVGNSENLTEIILYPEIYFDTVYAVGMWLRAYNPLQGGPTQSADPTDSSHVYVQIPSFTWQVVRIFPKDTVYAANHKIILTKLSATMNIADTLWSYNYPGSLPDGFVDVGSVPFTFHPMEQQPAPFKLGLAYTALPIGIAETDLAIYQVKNNEFHVLYGSEVSNGAVWAAIDKDSISYPFIVLADTLAPTITVRTYNDTIKKGDIVLNWFSVEDNVANAHWEFKYGQGNEAYVNTTGGYLTQSNDTTLMRQDIDGSVINESFGVRALIAAEDGISSDTENVSRCVKSTTGENFIINGKEWVPLRSRMGLYEPSLEKVFDQSVEVPDPWEYDIYQFRIYRWYNIEPSAGNEWIEYSDAVKSAFDFIPSRLIWCKTAEDQQIKFGEGVTTTLKEPYRVTLKPNNWTDISSPFQFPVMLRDMLEATTPYYDSLEVYHWIKDTATGNYLASDVYIFAFDSLTSEKDTLLSDQRYDGYTVYNHYDTEITLLIPPVSLPLSKYSTQEKRKCLGKNPNSWDISFKWKDADRDSFFKRVRCGYKKGEGEAVFGSLPPSMSNMQVGVFDDSRNRVFGWELKRRLDKNGGLTFKIVLNNNARKSANIEFYLDNLTALPEGFSTKLYDSKSGEYEECTSEKVSTLSLGANSSATRLLAIGSEDYFKNLLVAYMPMKLLKVYPNPFNGLIKIHFRIPLGIKEVQLSLYNVQGKLLWQGVDRKYVDAGEHLFYLDSKKAAGNRSLSAGVYLLRLSAKNSKGKILYGGEKKITCIK